MALNVPLSRTAISIVFVGVIIVPFQGMTFEVEKFLLVGQRVWQVALNEDESRLYTTNGVSNDISVIDVAKQKVIKSITVGEFPWGVVVGP